MTISRLEESQVFVNAQAQLESDIRQLVVTAVHTDPDARATLAAGLRVPLDTVDRLLTRTRWDLPLALSAADYLGVRLHVTGD